MKPTTTQLLAECLKLAEEFPDFVYTADDETKGWSNNRGGDSRYPDNCGCIVGQAYKRLTGKALPPQQEYYGIDSLLRYNVVGDSGTEVRKRIVSIQSLQDRQETWKQSVKSN